MSGVTFSVAALWMILGASPSTPVVQDQVDLIEVNHYYDSQGKLIFDQVIFYEWSQASERYHVTAWRLLKSSRQVPRKRWSDGAYVARWLDNEVYREVVGRNLRETWTQYDPELTEREYLPREFRRELSQPLAKKD